VGLFVRHRNIRIWGEMVMLIKDFIKAIKAEFGEVEFKATDLKTNKIYRSKNYEKVEEDIRKRRRIDTEAFW